MARKYKSIVDRIIANTKLDEVSGCWVWTSCVRRHYPCMTIRVDGKLKTVSPHRIMLEETHRVYFPFDEAGHLCHNPLCVNPSHLEIQTPAHNKAERRGYFPVSGERWIPVLFPFEEDAALDDAVDAFFEHGAELAAIGEECPF